MRSIQRLLLRGLCLSLLAMVAGCAEAQQQANNDLAVPCDGLGCGCAGDGDCGPGGHCEPAMRQCVACLVAGDCSMANVCSPSHSCVPGCAAGHGCGDAGLCSADLGACVECLTDKDCKSALAPRCDPAASRCVPCLPDKDNCGHAQYCAEDKKLFACAPGCKSDDDCTGEGGSDGGVPDGGSPDMGGGANKTPHCDPKMHQCAQCLVDGDCQLGMVCHSGVCVAGCDNQQSCPNALTCCTQLCVDTTTDYQNCGACGTMCMNGWNCCGSSCANPADDVANCGACGTVCKAAHGTPSCKLRNCVLTACDQGWADCDGAYLDGCEVNTDTNVANCGSCSNPCSLPNASPKCAGGMCAVAACSFGFADCDNMAVNGCEVNVFSDVNNCMNCGNVCMLAHATPKCSVGQCQISACDPGWVDCDTSPVDGCEVNITSDPLNCNGCGKSCSTVNGTPSCMGSMCQIACNAGFGNCDGDASNGCEININSDATHCGACNITCNLANATASCGNGKCQIASCSFGYADCDSQPLDGCEVNVLLDNLHCGNCGTPCAPAHASPKCNLGACQIAQCDPGYLDCNNNPNDGCEVSITNDALNCNGCNKACSTANGTASCVASTCDIACNAGFANCDGAVANGCEVNTNSDVNHCGGCPNVCAPANASPKCTGGSCQIASCNAGFANCDNNVANGCEINTNSDPMNCNGCGTVCNLPHATEKCSGGSCAIALCDPGFVDCNNNPNDGCEVNVTNDPSNCNGCGKVCPTVNGAPACVMSACSISCNAGFADCDMNVTNGCEVNTQTDVFHCGTCGNGCMLPNATPRCGNGTCQVSSCNFGFADCDAAPGNGCEVNKLNDPANCGGCGANCNLAHATAKCNIGSCAILSCNPGFVDCNNNPLDGCEVNITNDTGNCGACGHGCSTNNGTASCVNSMCQIACALNFADCDNNPADGCEVNIQNGDPNHCGNCNTICNLPNGTNSCSAGKCVVTSCGAGFADCDGLPGNGCEVNLNTDVNHCGGCLNACDLANATASCIGGACKVATCNAGFADCNGLASDGCEVSIFTDPSNCNGCGVLCSEANATAKCTGGMCGVANCNAGFADCDGNPGNGCEVNTTNSATHCGGCATACSTMNGTASCVNSACHIACNAGFLDCNNNPNDGCEVSDLVDVTHCGGCNTVCNPAHASPACVGGMCRIAACDPGFQDCDGNPADGCEVNITIDAGNCGGCGNLYMLAHASPICTGSVCHVGSCAVGFQDCNGIPTDGCEINTQTDAANCNGCGLVCSLANASPACVGGACHVSSCNGGFQDCNGVPTDGCEINTTNNVSHCGGCANVCSTNNGAASCVASACQIACNANFANCDGNVANGCEVNLLSDQTHCGGCGTSCNNLPAHTTSESCSNGSCITTGCQAGYFDVDGGNDGCECLQSAYGATCGVAVAGGSLTPGNSTQLSGNVVPINSNEWISFVFNGNGPGVAGRPFHPRVHLTTNPGGEFVFDIYQTCVNNVPGAPTTCPDEANGPSTNATDWEMAYTAPPVGASTNWPTQPIGLTATVYIHVYRAALKPTTCSTYTLTLSD